MNIANSNATTNKIHQNTGTSRWPEIVLRIFQLLSGGLSFFFLVPGQFFGTVGSGLDPSWQLALHEAFDKGRFFGKDFVFTYGPLGWLSTRLPYSSTAPLLLTADILLGILALFAFLGITLNLTRWYQLLALPIICWAAGSPFFSHNLVMLVFSLEIIYLILFVRSQKWLLLVPAGLLAICAFCVKLNIGFVGIGAFFLSIFLLVLKDRSNVLGGICSGIVMLITLVLTGYLLHIDLVGYTLGSLSIAKGYNDAMPLPPVGREEYVWSALAVLGVFSAWYLGNIKIIVRNIDTLLAGVVVPLFLFLLFKQAFVRADEHVFEFVTWCPVPIGLMAWAGINRLRLCAIPILASLVITPLLGNEGKVSLQYTLSRVEGFSNYFAQITKMSEITRTPPIPNDDTLPKEVVEIVRNHTVDIFPWEISALLANKLNYHPRPVPQSYVAYTEYLDGLNKDFFSSSTRPTYIVYAHHCADHRFCNFEDSHSRLALLQYYDVAGAWDYHILLRSRPTPRAVETLPGPTGEIPFGKSFKVPETSGLLFARVNLAHSPMGKIFSTLYQTASIEVIFTSGKSRTEAYRVIPPILKGGVILNRLVENIEDAKKFFSHSTEVRPITKIRISSVDPFSYRSTLSYSSNRIRFSEP